jgi:hypothetical protein
LSVPVPPENTTSLVLSVPTSVLDDATGTATWWPPRTSWGPKVLRVTASMPWLRTVIVVLGENVVVGKGWVTKAKPDGVISTLSVSDV